MANLIVEQFLPAATVAGAAQAEASATSGRGLGNTGWEFQLPVQFDAGFTGASGTKNTISGSGAAVTLTAAQSGSNILFDRAAGTVYTLPAPVVGLEYTFFVSVSVTSNAHKVITDAGTTFLTGSLMNIDTDSSNAVAAWTADGSTILSVSMNGTTTGGLKGTWMRFTCVSSTLWLVTGVDEGSGTVATPFATS